MDSHRIASALLDVKVNAQGAELTSLRHARYGDMLWQAGPIWPQHAPNLFPIVGQVAHDRLHVDGHAYEMSRHGFARRRRFEWADASDFGCRLVLHDDEATRAQFPFAFVLEIGYAVDAATLHVTYVVRNTGTRMLPASVGAHPAFRWPLADGAAKAVHTLAFERNEPAPIRRLADGLLKLEKYPTPIAGSMLRLDEELFVADAIVMDQLVSQSVRYAAPGTPAISVAWSGFRHLGIWSKPGADFVCIEPWYGYASPVDFDGPFEKKPGLMHIAPGTQATLTISVTIEDAAK